MFWNVNWAHIENHAFNASKVKFSRCPPDCQAQQIMWQGVLISVLFPSSTAGWTLFSATSYMKVKIINISQTHFFFRNTHKFCSNLVFFASKVACIWNNITKIASIYFDLDLDRPFHRKLKARPSGISLEATPLEIVPRRERSGWSQLDDTKSPGCCCFLASDYS